MARAAAKVTEPAPKAEPAAATRPAMSAALNVWWLLPSGLFSLLAIGILWALPRPIAPCIAIYPPPEDCGASDTSVVLPFLVLIVFTYAAIVACALLVTRPRGVVLGILTGFLGLLFLIGLVTVLAAADPGPVYYY